jgi:hypothetical protein
MRMLALILVALTAASCSSSANTAKIVQPELELDQVVGPEQLNFPSGPIDLRYDLHIDNRSTEPITLRRVELMTVTGGAYSLIRDFHTFNDTIAPGARGVVTVWAKGYGSGRTSRENEPVTVRAIAHFDSPVGAFRNIFIQRFDQYPGSNGPR